LIMNMRPGVDPPPERRVNFASKDSIARALSV
jgi:hypothetical protein